MEPAHILAIAVLVLIVLIYLWKNNKLPMFKKDGYVAMEGYSSYDDKYGVDTNMTPQRLL